MTDKRTTPQSQRGRHAAGPKHGAAKNRRLTLRPMTLLVAVLLVVGVGGIGFVAWQSAGLTRAAAEIESTPAPSLDDLSTNPIDFAALQADNPDVYAWLYIPNTNINVPILRSPNDDSFYLTHNRHGEPAVEGAIYTESCNAMDFSDPVTLIYGHNLDNHTMFSELHSFENPEFFRKNSAMYVFLPDRVLTYVIIAASRYDNRHIIKSFDFSDPAVVQEYFNYTTTPNSYTYNIRGDAHIEAGINKIVQLSTCTGDEEREGQRYLVTGVLVNSRPTAPAAAAAPTPEAA